MPVYLTSLPVPVFKFIFSVFDLFENSNCVVCLLNLCVFADRIAYSFMVGYLTPLYLDQSMKWRGNVARVPMS